VVIAVGPLAGTYIEALDVLPRSSRPNLWAVSELPIEHNPLPPQLQAQLAQTSALVVAEEHVRRGSFGSELALHLAESGVSLRHFRHLCARAHVYERYGSQSYLRRQSALDVPSMLAAVASLGAGA
jgi:transketolase